MALETALLGDGRKLQFEITKDAPKGAMKTTYFTPDRTQVVQTLSRGRCRQGSAA